MNIANRHQQVCVLREVKLIERRITSWNETFVRVELNLDFLD